VKKAQGQALPYPDAQPKSITMIDRGATSSPPRLPPRANRTMSAPDPAPLAPAAVEPPGELDLALAAVLSDVQEARDRSDAMLAAARRDGNPPGESLALLVHAMIGLREAELGPALQQLADAQACLDRAQDPRGLLLARHLRGQALRREGRLPEALVVLGELHGHGAGRPPVDAFLTAMALGTVQGMAEQQEASLASFYRGLALARRTGLPSLEVNALNNLGSVQLDLHNLEDALPLLQRCLQLALQIHSRRQRIFAAGNLLQCLCAMGRADDALTLAREHLIPVIRADDPPTLQRDEEIAHALIEAGCHEEARPYLARTPRPDVLTNPTTACRVWLEMRLLLVDDKPADALALGLARQGLAEDGSAMPLDRIRIAEITADAAKRCGDWRLAFEHQQRAYMLKDLLLGRAAKARFLSLQIEHDLRSARAERDDARRLAAQLEQSNATLREQMQANERLRRQLETLALEDPLTGLANRRHLMQAGQAALDQSRRTMSTTVVALVDLDHFKRINDRHGHDAGDRVLKAFAALLRGAIRSDDVGARYGGEEFVLVLRAVSPAVASERLRELLTQFGLMRFRGADGEIFTCGFSAGVAWTDAGQASLHRLLQQADEALYRAKHAGRARVVLAGDTGVTA
jgi:diguanylate cyclase (GGDEF)-like protein